MPVHETPRRALATDDWPYWSEPAVTANDSKGETVTLYNVSLPLPIKPSTGYPGAVLGGATTVIAELGIATFSGVQIDVAAPGYVLLASGQSLTGAENDAFDITAFTFNAPDIVSALRWSAGLSAMPARYLNLLDIVTSGSITIADAVRISRKVAGLEANP